MRRRRGRFVLRHADRCLAHLARLQPRHATCKRTRQHRRALSLDLQLRILATGGLGTLGGLGIAIHFATTNRPFSGVFAGLALAAWGVGMVFGSLYPLPDPLHNGFGLVLGATLLPIALMIALRGVAGLGVITLLALWLVAMVALLAITSGVGDLMTTKNVGLWQRGMALAMIPGLGIACEYLSRR